MNTQNSHYERLRRSYLGDIRSETQAINSKRASIRRLEDALSRAQIHPIFQAARENRRYTSRAQETYASVSDFVSELHTALDQYDLPGVLKSYENILQAVMKDKDDKLEAAMEFVKRAKEKIRDGNRSS
ncbi:hypothetical protein Tdes44962_MAKER07216 [Teratosphaeria destructans]|uniref:Uncharacterized protein n=1 Tax=Teratosphaeria destructans TaxID=418781 RepID=A0A9W7T046_9PEZI|nr:hypothetical protein Tdes44962_MAKER07216 [Teratosphaeria destructans]